MKKFISHEMRTLLAYIFPFALILLLTGCATTTPLMRAAEQGDIKAVKDLLDKGADVNEKGGNNLTALRRAVEEGNVGIVKLLLDKGADVNAKDAWGSTPLLAAAVKGHTEVVKLLLGRGADVHAENSLRETALELAAGHGHAEIVKLLLDKGSDVNKGLGDAAEKGHVEIVKLLLDKGADVNVMRDSDTWSPLSLAALQGQTAIMKILLDKGADLDYALTKCHGFVDYMAQKRIAEYKEKGERCVAILSEHRNKRDEAKRQEQEIARNKALDTQKVREMKEIIKEVMAGTAKTSKQAAASPSVQTGIDKPDITDSQKVMGADDIAIIIGVESYQNLPKSDYSCDDAQLVKIYIKALGFRERNTEFLTDEKATLSGIVKSVDVWLKNKAKPTSRIFIYYSGHGAPDPSSGEAYLVPYDGDPNYLAVTGYSLNRLYETLGKLQAAEIMVVLDACFSGAGGRSVLAKGARPLVITTGSAAVSNNIAVLSATQGSQISTSSPEKGHGIFTYYFLKAIKEGKNNIAEIYEHIKPQIEDEAKQINVLQSPSINPESEKIKGKFVLRK